MTAEGASQRGTSEERTEAWNRAGGPGVTPPLRVALLGCGTVGGAVLRLLGEQRGDLAARIGRPVEVAGVAVRRPGARDPAVAARRGSAGVSALRVALLGCGTVGSAVLRLMSELASESMSQRLREAPTECSEGARRSASTRGAARECAPARIGA